jgi:hypothetical protein
LSLIVFIAALPGEQQTAVTEKIAALGHEIAELTTPIEPPPSGEWG